MRARVILAAIAGILMATAARSSPTGVKLTDAELDEVRGGFSAAGGFSFTFGATVSTYIDGSLALQSTLRLDSQGPNVTTVYGTIPGASKAAPASLAGVNLAGATGAMLIVPGPGGDTAVVQNVSPTTLTNLVINTAKGQVIRQNTTITVTLANLQALETAAVQAQAIAALQGALASTAVLRGR